MPTLDQFIPESSIRSGWLKSKKARYHVEEVVSNVLLIPSGEPARVMFIEMIVREQPPGSTSCIPSAARLQHSTAQCCMQTQSVHISPPCLLSRGFFFVANRPFSCFGLFGLTCLCNHQKNPAAHAKICNDYANDAHPHINLRLPPPFATVTAAAAAATSTRGSGSSTAGAAAGASPGFCPFVLTNRMLFAAGGEIDCAEPVAVPADCILMRMPDPAPLRQDEEKCTGIAASFYAAAAAVFAESGAVKLPASSPSSSSSSSLSPSSVPAWKAFVDVNRRVLYKKPPVFESAMSPTSNTMDDTEDHTEDDAGNTTNGTSTSGAAAAAAAAKPKKPLMKPTFGQKRRSTPGPGLASSSSGGKKKQTKTVSTSAVKTPPKLGISLTGPSSSSSTSSSLAALVAPAAPGVKATATVLSFGNGSGGKKRKTDQVGAGAGAGAGVGAADATVPKKKRAKPKEKTPEEIEALVAKVQASIASGGFPKKGCTHIGMKEWLKVNGVPCEPKDVSTRNKCIEKIQGAIAAAAGLGTAPAPGNAPAPVVA